MRRLTTSVVVISLALMTLLQSQDGLHRQLPAPPFLSQLDSTNALKQIRQDLDVIFNSKAYRRSEISAYVWSITKNRVLYSKNSILCLTPASTTKLFSTVAALHAAGTKGTIDTEVRATGKLDSNGRLHGDLYLVGRGDALLTINDIEYLADLLYEAGIRNVDGRVYGDGSFFDNVTDRAVYSGDGEEVQKLGPVTALGMNKNRIAVVVSSTSRGVVSAQTIPASDAVEVVPYKKSSGPKGYLQKASKKQKYGDAPPPDPTPKQRKRKRKFRKSVRARVTVTSTIQSDGKQLLQYRGSPGRNRTVTLYVDMHTPALVAAGTLSNRMRSGGINVSDTVSVHKAPAASRVIATFRRPLVDMINIINKRSDNYLAEHIFKFVGGLYGGQTNTAQRARQAVLTTLDSLNVAQNGCTLNDGSGLSRRNSSSAQTQVDLLKYVAKTPYGNVFKQSLSIAGIDGTLRNRMVNTYAASNVHGKTGTLRNTSALAGYVTTFDGEELAFSFISNGPYVSSYKKSENSAAIRLANFSYDTNRKAPVVIEAEEIIGDTTLSPWNDEFFED